MDYKNLKDAIKAVIKKNGAQEITGQIMQDTLLSIVSKLGGNKTFAGVARPTTVPDTTDANIFYIAGENGTYVNFGGAKVENEAAVFVQISGGTWRAIYTGIQTSHGVNNQLQQEHEYFETEIDKVSADLTQFKQTEFNDVKEDVAGNAAEIAKNKSDITKINGEIATLNEATNTAGSELIRIEGKVDANLKDAVVVFGPSTNTGVYKGADILSFTNDTPTSTVTAYMSQYWDKLVKLASGKISGSVYAESNNANCTGGSCIGGTQFGYLKIEIEDYQKGGLAGEVLVLSFDSGPEHSEMAFSKSGATIDINVEKCFDLLYSSDCLFNVSNSDTLDVFLSKGDGNIYRDARRYTKLVSLQNIRRIKFSWAFGGEERCALLDEELKVIHIFRKDNEEFKLFDDEFNVSEYSGAAFFLFTTLKSRLKDSRLVVKELSGCIMNELGTLNNSVVNISNLNFQDEAIYTENLSSESKEGFNSMYSECSCIDYVIINGSVKETTSNAFIIDSDGKKNNISFFSNGGYGKGLFVINLKKYEKRKYIVYNNNKSENERPIVKIIPTRSIYSILSEIKSSINSSAASLYVFGDNINNSINGGRIDKEDEYMPQNEVQTLEEKPMYKNYAYYIAKRNKLRWSDYTYNKATLTDCKTKEAPDLNCVLTDDAIISMSDKKPDYITLWYGVNDAQFNPIMQRELWLKDKYKAEIAYPMQESEIGKDGYATAEQKAEVDKAVGRVGEVDYDNADSYFFAKFVGTENDEELTTWCGALNYAFPLLMSEYPEAKILIICPDHEKHGKLIREATIKMAEKWGVLYFDLNRLPYWYGSEKTKFENTQHDEMQWLLASGETAAPTVEGFNKSRYSYDGVRPSELGHKVISFPIGNKLING